MYLLLLSALLKYLHITPLSATPHKEKQQREANHSVIRRVTRVSPTTLGLLFTKSITLWIICCKDLSAISQI